MKLLQAALIILGIEYRTINKPGAYTQLHVLATAHNLKTFGVILGFVVAGVGWYLFTPPSYQQPFNPLVHVTYATDSAELSPTASPEPVKRVSSATVDSDVMPLIREVFGAHANDAIKIAKCESSLNPRAVNHNSNGSVDLGLFQINSIHGVDGRWLLNPKTNITIAHQLFTESGWTPWVCSRRVL